MIHVGSKVRVVRPGQFEVRGKVVDMGPDRFGRRIVKVRPDPDQVTVVAYPGQLDRWVELMECIEEEPVVPDPPDAPSPRPTRDDAESLRVLSDQLEELGLDAGAALLRDVAGRIERDVGTREGLADFGHEYAALMRSKLAEARANLVRLGEQGRDAGALDRELRFYRSHLDDLLGPSDINEGKHVVIKGTDIAGVCDTFEEALRVGYGTYGPRLFLVRKIERVETIHRI